jgi:hypothetical protein
MNKIFAINSLFGIFILIFCLKLRKFEYMKIIDKKTKIKKSVVMYKNIDLSEYDNLSIKELFGTNLL